MVNGHELGNCFSLNNTNPQVWITKSVLFSARIVNISFELSVRISLWCVSEQNLSALDEVRMTIFEFIS